jgi:glycosyltransferase involved in cell wall biosynthesis
MSATSDLTVLVLTLDEERHIERCIESVRGIASRVLVVDSGSNDRTCAIARGLGAEVLEHPFVSHARQINWGLDHADITTKWVMRLDADEYVTPGLAAMLPGLLERPGDAVGLTLNRRCIFMGKWLRHGALYPIKVLRVWRLGHGRCEDRWMDEHIVVEGRVAHADVDFVDENLNGITWWTNKHNRYATREAAEMLLARNTAPVAAGMGAQAAAKRWIKRNLYSRMPLGLRAFLYFVYRYFLRLGFLDGWPGFVFHFLQGWWYRMLVDVKVHEVEKAMRERNVGVEQAVEDVLGIATAKPDR